MTGQPINPLVCRSSATSTCPSKVDVGGINNTDVVSTSLTIKDPEQYSDALLTPVNPLAEDWKFSSKCPSGTSGFFTRESSGLCTVNPSNTTGLPISCGVKINDQVTEIAANGTTATQTFTTIHCNVGTLSNANGNIWRFITSDTHRIKLHFPREGAAVDIQGSMEHCEVAGNTTCKDSPGIVSNPLLRLSFLGCPNLAGGAAGCPDNTAAAIVTTTKGKGSGTTTTNNSNNTSNTQTMQIGGNSTASGPLPYFMYMPIGDLIVTGSGSAYALSGMYWVNTIKGSGQVEIAVPGSGIGDILNQYAGLSGGSDSDSEEAGAAPAFFEYTLRAVQQFFFRPGA